MSDRPLKPWPYTPAPQLVSDTGGTNTRVALADGGILRAGSIRRYANAQFGGLTEVLDQYLSDTQTTEVAGTCVAIAGPVRGDMGEMTNLNWRIAGDDLRALTGAPRVAILNDMQAQGHALGQIDARHLRTLLPGQPADPDATQLVIGAGTGFNAAPVHTMGSQRLVAASECGHVHLPQHTEQERELARHLATRHGVATVEEVLCGRGLVALHAWTSGQTLEPGAVIEAIEQGTDAGRATATLYATIMGRVLASLALTHLPYGGMYLIGGVARAMTPHLLAHGLKEAFTEMGRFSDLMQVFPVHVVEDDYAALIGCAAHLTRLQSA